MTSCATTAARSCVFSEKNAAREVPRAVRAFDPALSRRADSAWSYKTNYLNAICRVFHQEGWIAESSSGFGIRKGRHNGIPADRIIFQRPRTRTRRSGAGRRGRRDDPGG